MRKLLSTLFSTLQGGIRGGLLFLALLTSISLWAYDYDFEYNEIRYKIISETGLFGTVEVVGSYTNYATHFTIPETFIYDGVHYEVTRIGDGAFNKHKTITVIELPNSITSIGKNAFENSTLKEITIPNSVTEIEEYAFDGCAKLTSVTLGEGVTTIGENAFSSCSSLTSITIPNSVTTIGHWAFMACSSLASITIGNSVTSMGYDAFSRCSSLKSVIWNAKNTVSAYEPFEGSPIATITFTDNVETIPSGICYYMSSLTSVSIGKNVIRIGDSAFAGCTLLASVTLPNSLISIEGGAFCNCPSLSSITIPKSVTNLENDAFYMCYFAADNFINHSSLQSYGRATIVDADIDGLLIIDSTLIKCRPNVVSAIVPKGVVDIKSHAFKESPLLTSITIGNDVKTIGNNAFEACPSLMSVVICDSVQTINDKAFLNCTSLSSVSISDTTTYIGKYAFAGTAWFNNQPDGLVYINNVLYKYKGTMPTNTSIDIVQGTLFISPEAFKDCSSLASVTIPNSVLGIGNSAFYGCSSLTEITIPYSVMLVQSQAFDYCNSLSSVKWNAKGIPNVPSEYTGGGMPSLGDGWIVGGINYFNMFNTGSYVTSFVFGDSVEHIPASLCEDMTGLKSITLPKSVKTIGRYAFYGCKSLTEITIPENITYMGHFAFGNCPSLTSVTWNAKTCRDFYHTIPNTTGGRPSEYPFYNNYITEFMFGDSVEYIPAYLCYNMDSLNSVVIPNNVTSIGIKAFKSCTNLDSVTIGNNLTSIGYEAFRYCSSLTSITIPNSVITIEEYAFDGCSGLVSVVIGDNLTSIGTSAFSECTSLTSITIPNSVTSIGAGAFKSCNNLDSVTIGNNLTSIGTGAFSYCSSLSSITIPNSVITIEEYAFDGCSDLASVVIGDNLTSIGTSAFRECTSLTSIAIPNSVTSIGNSAFVDCSSLTSVTIGNKVSSIGYNAFSGCSSLTQTNYTGDVADWCRIAFNQSTSNPTCYSKNLFINGEEIKELLIQNTISSIANYAFYNCENISSVKIPESVKSIGSDAFGGCKKLFDIYSYPTTPPKAEESSFANYNVNLYVPCDNLRDYQMDMVFGSFKYIQCLEDTTPSEPTDSTIYHPTEYVTICEGNVYIWRSNTCYQSGIYTHTETIEDGEYIYHHVYTLELTILPLETIEYAIEAEGEYVWHDIVYTESGLYTYEYECTTEKLHLVIIPSKENQSAVVIEPSTNSATITWQKEDDAVNYIIVIQQDNEMVCTLIFDAHGNLLLEQHATSTESSKNEIQYAEKRGDSFQYTIMGLTPTTNYSYTLTTTNAAYQTLNTYSGEFITESLTGIEDIYSPSDRTDTQKFLQSGQLLILRDGKIYNVMGQEM